MGAADITTILSKISALADGDTITSGEALTAGEVRLVCAEWYSTEDERRTTRNKLRKEKRRKLAPSKRIRRGR